MRTACPPLRFLGLSLLGGALLAWTGCALEEGERFGRSGTQPGVLRVHVREPVVELDPARARTPLERAIARQLFSALVETSTGSGERPVPALASSWSQPSPGHIVLVLRKDAKFSNGQPLTAHDVVWSWRRALRASTGAADRRLSATIKNGAELAAGTLLRVVATEPMRTKGPPYSVFLDDTARDRADRVGSSSGAGDPAEGAFLPGTAVRVLDTNTRTPAGEAVPLSRSPEGGAAASSLARGEMATVIALVEIPATKGAPARTMLQLRAPDGAAGWASDDVLSRHVPTIGVVPVVHRGGDAPVLRAGPDSMAPVRATLGDESGVEVLERGAPFSLVVDVASGKTGFLDSALLEDTARERRWFLVEEQAPSSSTRIRGWVSERDLAFDPGLLDVVAVDEHTLEVGLAVDVDRALAAFADAAFRPVPARVVEEHGRAWTQAGTIVTSGPFTLAAEGAQDEGRDDDDTALVLVRSPTSFEAARAQLARVELVYVERPTSALHLYRAGLIDVLLDGALPPELARALSRAADWRAGAQGGALIAPEVVGLSPSGLELRDVRVDAR